MLLLWQNVTAKYCSKKSPTEIKVFIRYRGIIASDVKNCMTKVTNDFELIVATATLQALTKSMMTTFPNDIKHLAVTSLFKMKSRVSSLKKGLIGKFHKLASFKINFQNIQILKNDPFSSCSELVTHIDLSSNQINDLVSNVFIHCASLKSINLNNNKIKKLGHGTFASLQDLEEVDLSQNPIATFDFLFFEKSPYQFHFHDRYTFHFLQLFA